MRRYFNNDFLETLLRKSRLVIFDMNGLIVDDERLQLESVNGALESFAIQIDEEYWKNSCLGKRTDQFFTLILKERGIAPAHDVIQKLLREKNMLYDVRISVKVREIVRPGVLDFMDHITASREQKMALATSALPEEVESILGKPGLDIKGRFDFIANGADITKTKPDPEIYLLLSHRSGISPPGCLVIEDSGVGVKAAANAGMTCIAVPNSFTLTHDFSTAAFVVDSLKRDAVVLAS